MYHQMYATVSLYQVIFGAQTMMCMNVKWVHKQNTVPLKGQFAGIVYAEAV